MKTSIKQLDTVAAEMIPIRMIISIAIIAAIGALVGVAYWNFSITASEHQVENDCSALESQLYTMIGSGVARDVDEINVGEGTMRSQTFFLPDSLIYLSFGVDPDPDNNGVLETGLTENGAIICYQASGGSKHIFWLPKDQMRFREGSYDTLLSKWVINGDGQGYILTGSGKSTVLCELVEKNDELFILIHATDTFEPSP